MGDNSISDKKRALLNYKEQLLDEISYCLKRIEETRNNKPNYENDAYSSDEEFTITPIFPDTSLSRLKNERDMLMTCVQATLELTGIVVLQSETTPLSDDPVFEGEPPVTEDGVWMDVAAECRIDLVMFSMTFYVHKPYRSFGPLSFRALKVNLVKKKIETELEKSVLPTLTRPSDAVEVLKNYASAHRSRRTTLLRLAEKYGELLYMECMDDGGYILKCADLLKVSWTLQNKWSPISPFHHRMVFDLEYMDESYLKTIKHAHRQLSDPSIDTNERTHYLTKIITTCLEAKGPTQELYESMESDQESIRRLEKTTLDEEPEIPSINNKRKRDSDIMAPPKALPKKSKPKGKENVNSETKTTKRSISDNDVGNNKKAKLNDAVTKTNKTKENELNKGASSKIKLGNAKQKEGIGSKDKAEVSSSKNSERTSVASSKNNLNQEKNNINTQKEVLPSSKNDQLKLTNKNKKVVASSKNNVPSNIRKPENNNIKAVNSEGNVANFENEEGKITSKNKKVIKSSKETHVISSKNNQKNAGKPVKNNPNAKLSAKENVSSFKSDQFASKNTKVSKNDKGFNEIEKGIQTKNKETQNKPEKTKNSQQENNGNELLNKAKANTNKNKVVSSKDSANNEAIDKAASKNHKSNAIMATSQDNKVIKVKKTTSKESTIENNKLTEKAKTKSNSAKKKTIEENPEKQNDNKAKNAKTSESSKVNEYSKNNDVHNVVASKKNAYKIKDKIADITGTVLNDKLTGKQSLPKLPQNISNKNIQKNIQINNLKKVTSNISKKINTSNTIQNDLKTSKIPQKKAGVVKRSPLRISPRKSMSIFKHSSQNSFEKKKFIQKTMTGIPRLMKKSDALNKI